MIATPSGMRVLVTGASGVVGRVFRQYYREYYSLRLTRHRTPVKTSAGEILSGERADPVHPGEKLVAMWISGRDVAQLIQRSLEADLRFGIFYGTSDNTPAVFGISDAKERLGYRPQDRLEDYLP